MGLCNASQTPENLEIDDNMYRSEAEYKKTTNLLLLGTGNTGKTTFHRQFQISLGDGFSAKERDALRMYIEQQVVHYMTKLSEIALALDSHLHDPSLPISDPVESAAEHMQQVEFQDGLDANTIDHIKTLWEDTTIQTIFYRHTDLQRTLPDFPPVTIPESCEYFWNSIDRISLFDYRPTPQDVVQLRSPTTGAVCTHFAIKDNIFRVTDVGGQRCERNKWLHVFEDTHAVLYVISLTAYDEVLYEDGRVNAMDEQFRVFEETINKPCFDNVTIIIFLNKTDLLQKKIDDGRYLTSYFKDYDGNHSVDEYCSFIAEKFLDRDEKKEDRTFFTHRTCATDTEQVEMVLTDVTKMFVVEGIRSIGLL